MDNSITLQVTCGALAVSVNLVGYSARISVHVPASFQHHPPGY